MSGKKDNDSHFLNIHFISITLETSHFDISGKDIKEEHPENKNDKFVLFSIFQFDYQELIVMKNI